MTTAGTLHQRHSNDKDQEEMTPDCKNPMNLKLRWTFAECQACDGIIPRDSLFIDQHGNMVFETPAIDIVIDYLN